MIDKRQGDLEYKTNACKERGQPTQEVFLSTSERWHWYKKGEDEDDVDDDVNDDDEKKIKKNTETDNSKKKSTK